MLSWTNPFYSSTSIIWLIMVSFLNLDWLCLPFAALHIPYTSSLSLFPYLQIYMYSGELFISWMAIISFELLSYHHSYLFKIFSELR